MKGDYQRWQQRQQKRYRQHRSAMDVYENTLAKVVAASGDGKSYRQGNEELNFKLRENEVYAFYCPDGDGMYYRTVMLKKMGINDTLKPLVGNPVYGVVPDGIQVIKPEKVYQQIQQHNTRAFPYKPYGIGQ
jgi:hypothetical protein